MISTINLKTINELREDMAFFIPSYQRGYRWDKQQVKNLLVDIYDFMRLESSNFYCLQPIVVRSRHKDEELGITHYEVIDGQQRLTTIKIILSYLNKISFPVAYETRPGSEDILDNLHKEVLEENIDYHFFKEAYATVKNWFAEPRQDGKTFEDKFHIALGERVKVIWYEVDPSIEVRAVFSRLNIGKIPLTNAELIKAFILTSNIEKQLEMANEWDSIERKLRNDRLWYFINPTKDYSSRIELLFDLYTKNTKSPNPDIFYTFYKIQEQSDLLVVWLQIKAYLALFEEWFEDREIYHYIGFLIQRQNIADIIALYEDDRIEDKLAFRGALKQQIHQQIRVIDLSELQYGQDNEDIKKILLLFNIATTLNQKNHEARFPFDTYVKGNWSIEHIHAQNTKGLRTKDQWHAWIFDTIQLFNKSNNPDDSTMVNILSVHLNNQNLTQEEFDDLFAEIIDFKGERFGSDVDTIDNLALLDQETNSALSNHFYPVKHRKLIDYDKMGNFIPICTRNVFIKYYSQNVEHFQLWSESDRSDYLTAIEESFQVFSEGEAK